MKKIPARLLMLTGSLLSLISLILFFGFGKYGVSDMMTYLTTGITLVLIGVHLHLNLLNKEYFYYYIFPVYLFLIGVIIHNYYTGETSFNDVLMGVIPNTFMIAGCIIGFILNKFTHRDAGRLNGK